MCAVEEFEVIIVGNVLELLAWILMIELDFTGVEANMRALKVAQL